MIVHIFTPPERDYYGLEKHWSEAKTDPARPVGGASRAVAGVGECGQPYRVDGYSRVMPDDDGLTPSIPRMSAVRDRCPACARRLITTRFDTTFRLPDRSERLCFGIPGGLCEDCSQLYIDPDLIELLDLGEGRCVFAIESDLVVQEQAWSSEATDRQALRRSAADVVDHPETERQAPLRLVRSTARARP